MTIRELEAAFKSVPDELKDLPVKYSDDGHPQTVRCAYVKDDNIEGMHVCFDVTLLAGKVREEDMLFAETETKRDFDKDQAEMREGMKPFHITPQDVNITVDFIGEGGPMITLVAFDKVNCGVHTGKFSVTRTRRETNSPNFHFQSLLQSVHEGIFKGMYGWCSATDATKDMITKHAYNLVNEWIGNVEHENWWIRNFCLGARK